MKAISKSRELVKKHNYEAPKAILKAGNQVYLLILVNFDALGSGFAFPIRICIPIHGTAK
jgi:hypothetical protein